MILSHQVLCDLQGEKEKKGGGMDGNGSEGRNKEGKEVGRHFGQPS